MAKELSSPLKNASSTPTGEASHDPFYPFEEEPELVPYVGIVVFANRIGKLQQVSVVGHLKGE